MKVFKISAVVCIAVVLALPCLAAKAAPLGTIDIVHDGFGANEVVHVWGGGYDGDEVYSGVYGLNKSAGTGDGNIWPNGLMPTFCIELHQLAPQCTLTYDVVRPSSVYNSLLGETLGQTKATYLRELWGRFYEPAWASGSPYTTQQNNSAAAFGAAVWEIVYEDLPCSPAGWDVATDGTVGAGGFRAASLDTDLANWYLHSLTGCGPKADLYAFTNCGKQDYIAVPEPATVTLLGLSAIFSLIRRKRTAA